MTAALRHPLQIGKSILEQGEPAAGGLHDLGGARNRARIAGDADDGAITGRIVWSTRQRAAKGAIEKAAAAGAGKNPARGTAEHGKVTSQSASDSVSAVA